MIYDHFKKSQKTWDLIAESFDNTRRKPWKQTIEFIDLLKKNDVVADIGCGNGRHLSFIVKNCKTVIGLDISKNLLKITKKKIDETKNKTILIQGNLVYLPISENTLDAVLYIAALHNIKGRKNRIESLIELKRVLKKDGKALISVWSKEQEKFQKCFSKTNDDTNEIGDINIYWRQNKLNVPRFYHLYDKEEFIEDIKRSGLKIENILETKILSHKYIDNYFAIVRKS